MIDQEYQLENTVLETTEALTLWQTERGLVEISTGTLAVPINLGDERKGYVFHGQGRLLLDTIVETDRGAVGKPVEKKVNKPFLMLGEAEKMLEHLAGASNEDLGRMGYENEKEVVAKAQEIFDRFFKERRTQRRQCFNVLKGLVFAFPSDTNSLDLLILNDSKLIYKAMNIVFASDGDRVVLKSPEHIAVSTNGKSIVVNKKCMSLKMP